MGPKGYGRTRNARPGLVPSPDMRRGPLRPVPPARPRLGARPGLAALACAFALTLPPPVVAGDGPPSGAPAAAPRGVPVYDDAPLVLREALRIDRAGTAARSLVHTDAVEALLVADEWLAPRPGAELELPDRTMRRFVRVEAGEDGVFAGEVATRGAYLSCRVRADGPRVALLAASGHDFVYVNGELRPGDPYGFGFVALPVALRDGANELLFRASRGRFLARLLPPKAPAYVAEADATLPDLLRGGVDGEGSVWAAVVVVNARPGALKGRVRARWADEPGATSDGPVEVPGLSVGKVTFRLPTRASLEGPSAPLRVDLLDADGAPVEGGAGAFSLVVRGEGEVVRRTYRSEVDGSALPYAVSPPEGRPVRSLVLSLHGAGVDDLSQARAYGRRAFDVVVCPTNRRPFGFDWEDWGRRDALEALAAATKAWRPDPSRVFLTGHSMGGHGTWQLGVLFPDRFAGVAPSAGWRSFSTYGGGAPASADPVAAMLARAASPSDTTAYVGNLARSAVYVLHGDADDNVPVSEARAMRAALAPIVPDLHAHEQPGAGHWWDLSDAPGADCVDWPPIFDLFSRRRLPAADEVRVVEFVTPDPTVSSRAFWVEVVGQERSRLPTRVRFERDLARRRIVGVTENVRALVLDASALAGAAPIAVTIDGVEIQAEGVARGAASPLRFERDEGRWRQVEAFRPGWKSAGFSGPFKEVFDRRFVLVVGTRGSGEETAWARRKARLDAETWWYRGSGAALVLDDVAFDARANEGRNVVLYGHAEMNAAWGPLLGSGPVRVARGAVEVGERRIAGDDVAVLCVRPKAAQDGALVGVVAGTGLAGLRLTERLPCFTSGVGIPDLVLLSPRMLTGGEAGLVGAGFFGPDWRVGTGDFAWR